MIENQEHSFSFDGKKLSDLFIQPSDISVCSVAVLKVQEIEFVVAELLVILLQEPAFDKRFFALEIRITGVPTAFGFYH